MGFWWQRLLRVEQDGDFATEFNRDGEVGGFVGMLGCNLAKKEITMRTVVSGVRKEQHPVESNRVFRWATGV
jgi:hypothetical protein